MLIRRTDKAWATQTLSDDAKRKAFYFYGPQRTGRALFKAHCAGHRLSYGCALSGLSRPAVAAIMQGEHHKEGTDFFCGLTNDSLLLMEILLYVHYWLPVCPSACLSSVSFLKGESLSLAHSLP